MFKYLCSVIHFPKREKREIFNKLIWNIKSNVVQLHPWECGDLVTDNLQKVTLQFICSLHNTGLHGGAVNRDYKMAQHKADTQVKRDQEKKTSLSQ